jgi:thioredoxin-like negative regulator of GroEL
MMKRIGDWRLEDELNRSDDPVVVLFTASGTRRGQELRRDVQALARDYFLTRFFEVDLSENPGLAARFEIQRVPILIIFAGTKEIFRHAGADPRAALVRALGRAPTPESDAPAGIDE